jgi:hypothetical protein
MLIVPKTRHRSLIAHRMRGVVDDWPQLTQAFALKVRLALLLRQHCGRFLTLALSLPRRSVCETDAEQPAEQRERAADGRRYERAGKRHARHSGVVH